MLKMSTKKVHMKAMVPRTLVIVLSSPPGVVTGRVGERAPVSDAGGVAIGVDISLLSRTMLKEVTRKEVMKGDGIIDGRKSGTLTVPYILQKFPRVLFLVAGGLRFARNRGWANDPALNCQRLHGEEAAISQRALLRMRPHVFQKSPWFTRDQKSYNVPPRTN